MLVLTRKPGEKVRIGNAITLTVLTVQGGRVRLGIEAPDQIPVHRGELVEWHEDTAPLPTYVVRACC
jgi:carbon storage regulator